MWEVIQNLTNSLLKLNNPVLINSIPMNTKTLMTVRGEPIILDTDANIISFNAGLTIDADGCPHCYAPEGSGLIGLDYLANAGSSGNWYGIITDSKGNPHIQGNSDPYPGYYLSATSYQNHSYSITDPRRYLDSEKVSYIVLPSPLFKLVDPKVLGSKVKVTNTENGKSAYAMVGDAGPATHLGEGSIELANLLGIPSCPKNGGTDFKILKFEVYLNVPYNE